jgi:pyocin large subunit-like protein
LVGALLHGYPRLINAVELIKLNSTVERYSLHGSIKVNEAVDSKMAANELEREGVVVMCDYLMEEC